VVDKGQHYTKEVKNGTSGCLVRETLALSHIANSNNTIFEGLMEDRLISNKLPR